VEARLIIFILGESSRASPHSENPYLDPDPSPYFALLTPTSLPGPLAVTSSALAFTALSGSQTVLDVGDAIRNVLNSTLLLIFTTSLFIWGFLVNRRRAWRFDGGTAMFGIGSLFLAVISTTFNFVAVKEDGIDWLQHLLFAAILWQIWLGWWWWVGSGMGIGEVEVSRAIKRQQRGLPPCRVVLCPSSPSFAFTVLSHLLAESLPGPC
jgi:hypothetical protein